MRPKIPKSILSRIIDLPCTLETQAHAKEPETLGLHRMLGFPDHIPGRTIAFFQTGSDYAVMTGNGNDARRLDIPFVQIVAAASYLQGHVLTHVLKRVKSLGELEHAVLSGALADAGRKIMNDMDGDRNPWPWAGVGIIPCSPDGEEFAFARKDHLHPRAGYCCRLAFIGGGMDPNEILGDWGGEAESAYAAMLRETFEEIRVVDIAREIAESVRAYHGAVRTRCYLYEDSGQPTDGAIRAFVARAPSNEAWDRWRRIFTKEIDGLGEANPELVTKSTLVSLLQRDDAAADERERVLRETPHADIAKEEVDDLRLFSRKYVLDAAQWKRNREQAYACAAFPLTRRGNFAFISGIAPVIRRVLAAEGLI